MKLILSLLFSPFCIAHSAISAQPNILWFVVDDMSAHFSCYGEKLIQTPAVDKIAPPRGSRVARQPGERCGSAIDRASLWTSDRVRNDLHQLHFVCFVVQLNGWI